MAPGASLHKKSHTKAPISSKPCSSSLVVNLLVETVFVDEPDGAVEVLVTVTIVVVDVFVT